MTTPIHLCIVYGYFQITLEELSCCYRDHIIHKAKNIYYGSHTKVCWHPMWNTKNKFSTSEKALRRFYVARENAVMKCSLFHGHTGNTLSSSLKQVPWSKVGYKVVGTHTWYHLVGFGRGLKKQKMYWIATVWGHLTQGYMYHSLINLHAMFLLLFSH